ncbi:MULTISPECIES: hypothetical protein [unclassified Dehalobacter]|uniref:hypothetical protein n=1 Tax=unclassified Dehalobacter TaxID=2635733 RepID=UPI0002F3C6A1|nr:MULTISPECIES: hypothetical protein [unclassified Dehalobacter]
MNNTEKTNPYEVLIQELSVITNRVEYLKDLEHRISNEQDPKEKELMYNTYISVSKLNYKELQDSSIKAMAANIETITRANDASEKLIVQNEVLKDKLFEEREAHEQFYDHLCFCMMVDPKGTFEMILDQVERSEKIKDQSGTAWEWSPGFPLMARVRMAYRLIFGVKERRVLQELQ